LNTLFTAFHCQIAMVTINSAFIFISISFSVWYNYSITDRNLTWPIN